jgi:hypothetical protein
VMNLLQFANISTEFQNDSVYNFAILLFFHRNGMNYER